VDPPLAIPPRPPRHGHRPDDRSEDRPSGPPRDPPGPSDDNAPSRPAGSAEDRVPRALPDERGGPPDDHGPGPGGPRGRRFIPHNRLILPFRPHGAHGVLVARGVHGGPPGLTGPLLVLVGGF